MLQRLNSRQVQPASTCRVEALHQAENPEALIGPCYPSLLVGQRINSRRGKPRRSRATAPTQHSVHKTRVPLWEKWATVLDPSSRAVAQRFCQGREELVHKKRKLWGSPQRYWIYLQWSMGKFRPNDTLKNRDFGGKQVTRLVGPWAQELKL